MKLHIAACALSLGLLSVLPAAAQTTPMTCTESAMKSHNETMMKMADGTKKTAAMKEMDMAKDMMAKKDDKACMMHMEKAVQEMK